MSTTEIIRPTTAGLMEKRSKPAKANMGQILRWLVLFGGGVLMIMPTAHMITTRLIWRMEENRSTPYSERPT